MNQLTQYISGAIRTESPAALIHVDAFRIRLLHVALGVTGESGEISCQQHQWEYQGGRVDAFNIIEECGDMMWYLALLLDAIQCDFEFGNVDTAIIDPHGHNECCLMISTFTGNISDIIKKHVIYGRDLNRTELLIQAKSLFRCLVYLALEHRLSIEDVAEKNLAKLKARYPEKWSAEAEQNRNLEAERLAAESK